MLLLSDDELIRFWNKVLFGADEDCWNWTACRSGARHLNWYGRFCFRGRRYYAHRFAFCAVRGLHPDYLSDECAILHLCDNPLCCNPRHLELGTQLANIQDMIRKNRHRGGRRRKVTTVEELPV